MKINLKEIERKTGSISACLFALTFLILFNCTMQDDVPVPLNNEAFNDKSVISDASARIADLPGDVIYLEGFSLFDVYAIKEHKIVTSNDVNRLTCKATFTRVGDQDYVLETKEYFGDILAREVTWSVKMTPSGILNLSWPVPYFSSDPSGAEFKTLIEQAQFHTGYIFSGPGVNEGTMNFKGTFDGNRFYVSAGLTAKQVRPGSMDIYQEMVDGPIQFNVAFDLYVSVE